ncbi:MAG: hypothetical protein ACE5KX_06660 [Acidimicrobiia bacterium]
MTDMALPGRVQRDRAAPPRWAPEVLSRARKIAPERGDVVKKLILLVIMLVIVAAVVRQLTHEHD